MINIVCLKWGDKYDPDYVNKLFSSIKRNTTVEFKFHCFTENGSDLNQEIIIHDLPYKSLEGWWNKVYLFSNQINIPLGEKIFYVDLDTVITDNIDDLLSHPTTKMIVLKDFLHGLAKTAGTMGSGLMAWTHGNYTKIWNQFIQNPEAAIKQVEPHGDQHWIDFCINERFRVYWQDILPGRVVSFKVNCLDGLPSKAAIICYHGRPSIPESAYTTEKIWKFNVTPQPWVLDYWRE